MTRNEILAQYDVTVDGVILDFGKFENEPLYAPYFYEHASDGEELSFMEDGCGAYVSLVKVDDDDRAMFPEFPADALYVVVEELDTGFVQIDHITSEAHAAQVRAAYEADDECDDMFAPEDET